MANVIHRTTLAYRRSVNTPDFPEPTWKHSPDMSAVAGVSLQYWKWDGVAERPVEMTAGEKTAVDAASIESGKEAHLDSFDVLSLRVLFDHENRVRVLEGKGTITAVQFRAALKARL